MDNNISRLRVLFTVYILFYHSVDDYFLGHLDTIHPHEELEFLRGITNFVLQGFVFISGFLMARGFFCYGKYSNKFKFFIDKTQRLLIPYFVGGALLCALYSVSWTEVFYGAKHLWFLLMLFDVMLVAVFSFTLLKESNRLVDVSIFFILIILSSFVHKYSDLPNLFGWQTALSYIPAFLTGTFMVKYKFDEKLLNMRKIIFYSSFYIVLIFAVSFVFMQSLPFGLFYMHLPNYALLPFLYVLFCKLFKSSAALLIRSIDKNSLGIYILHNFVGKYTLFYYVPSFVVFYDEHYVLAPICLFVWMFSAAWIVSNIMLKNKYTAMLIGA